jgi:hypothetical protein
MISAAMDNDEGLELKSSTSASELLEGDEEATYDADTDNDETLTRQNYPRRERPKRDRSETKRNTPRNDSSSSDAPNASHGRGMHMLFRLPYALSYFTLVCYCEGTLSMNAFNSSYHSMPSNYSSAYHADPNINEFLTLIIVIIQSTGKLGQAGHR